MVFLNPVAPHLLLPSPLPSTTCAAGDSLCCSAPLRRQSRSCRRFCSLPESIAAPHYLPL
jgi:hypothetical protein